MNSRRADNGNRAARVVRGVPVRSWSWMLALVAVTAVLAMHGVTSAHGLHAMSDLTSTASSFNPEPTSGSHDAPDHGSRHRNPVGADTAAVACAFAVLVAVRRPVSGSAPSGMLRLVPLQWVSQLCAPPDPPIPRLVVT